jgi:hypothetical protein
MTVDASKGHRLIVMLDVLEHVAAPERLGRRAGLVTLESRYMFQSLVVPKLLVRAREALTSESAHVPRIPRPALNRAIQAWFRGEDAVAGCLPVRRVAHDGRDTARS